MNPRGSSGKKEHVTLIKCVLLPAVWQAPKYNSHRIVAGRPDGSAGRYLSEINRMLFVRLRRNNRDRPAAAPNHRNGILLSCSCFNARVEQSASKWFLFSYLAPIWSYECKGQEGVRRHAGWRGFLNQSGGLGTPRVLIVTEERTHQRSNVVMILCSYYQERQFQLLFRTFSLC